MYRQIRFAIKLPFNLLFRIVNPLVLLVIKLQGIDWKRRKALGRDSQIKRQRYGRIDFRFNRMQLHVFLVKLRRNST